MEKVVINEVGLRDGLQNQPQFIRTEDKFLLFQKLHAAGLREFEITSFVNPKAVPQMADAAQLLSLLPALESGRYTALIPNRRGYELALASDVRSIALVMSSTDEFNLRNLRMTLEQVIAVCREIIQQAKKDQVFVRVYISGACGCPYKGEVATDHIFRLVEKVADADEISIADTIGCGSPNQIRALLKPLVAQYGAAKFNLHLHDTRGMAVANAWAGLDEGIRNFDASIGGLGGCPFAPGAAGNLATEDLVVLLDGCGYQTGVDTGLLLEAIAVAEDLIGIPLGGKSRKWLQQPRSGHCNL